MKLCKILLISQIVLSLAISPVFTQEILPNSMLPQHELLIKGDMRDQQAITDEKEDSDITRKFFRRLLRRIMRRLIRSRARRIANSILKGPRRSLPVTENPANLQIQDSPQDAQPAVGPGSPGALTLRGTATEYAENMLGLGDCDLIDYILDAGFILFAFQAADGSIVEVWVEEETGEILQGTHITSQYDVSGYLISKITDRYDEEGDLIDRREVTDIEYDVLGRVVAETMMDYYNDGGTLILVARSEITYNEFDEEGRVRGQTIHTYDEHGHLMDWQEIQYERYDMLGRLIELLVITYDDEGNFLDVKRIINGYGVDASVLFARVRYYVENMLHMGTIPLISQNLTRTYGNVAEYVFAAGGNSVVKVRVNTRDGEVIEAKHIESEFDELGRLVSEEISTYNGRGDLINFERIVHIDGPNAAELIDIATQYVENTLSLGDCDLIDHVLDAGFVMFAFQAGDGSIVEVWLEEETGKIFQGTHITSRYDVSGYLISKITAIYDEIGNLMDYREITNIEYDRLGRVVSETVLIFADDGGVLIDRLEVTYNEFDEEGRVRAQTIRTYDEHGNLMYWQEIQYERYDMLGRLIEQLVITYDDEGNLLDVKCIIKGYRLDASVLFARVRYYVENTLNMGTRPLISQNLTRTYDDVAEYVFVAGGNSVVKVRVNTRDGEVIEARHIESEFDELGRLVSEEISTYNGRGDLINFERIIHIDGPSAAELIDIATQYVESTLGLADCTLIDMEYRDVDHEWDENDATFVFQAEDGSIIEVWLLADTGEIIEGMRLSSEYNEAGYLTAKTVIEYDHEGNLIWQMEITDIQYDGLGRVISETILKYYYEGDTWVLVERNEVTNAEFDEQGRITFQRIYSYTDEDTYLLEIETIYDALGRREEQRIWKYMEFEGEFMLISMQVMSTSHPDAGILYAFARYYVENMINMGSLPLISQTLLEEWMTIVEYVFDGEGDSVVIVKVKGNWDYDLERQEWIEYNEVLEAKHIESEFDELGRLVSEEISTYNGRGDLINFERIIHIEGPSAATLRETATQYVENTLGLGACDLIDYMLADGAVVFVLQASDGVIVEVWMEETGLIIVGTYTSNEYDRSGYLVSKIIAQYDEAGNLMDYQEITNIEYDRFGRVVSETISIFEDEGSVLLERCEVMYNEFDGEGRISHMTVVTYAGDGAFIERQEIYYSEYDALGNAAQVVITRYNERGDPVSHIIMTNRYSVSERALARVRYYVDDMLHLGAPLLISQTQTIGGILEYVFDGEGNSVLTVRLNERTGEIIDATRIESEFDELGRLVSEEISAYDEHGNLIDHRVEIIETALAGAMYDAGKKEETFVEEKTSDDEDRKINQNRDAYKKMDFEAGIQTYFSDIPEGVKIIPNVAVGYTSVKSQKKDVF